MPAGRPTKATEANLDLAWDYVDGRYAEAPQSEAIPTVEGLAVFLDIHKDTLYERDEFSDVLARLKSKQAAALISGGLTNKYNSTIAKLLLASKHDFVEKTATDLTTKDQPIQPVSHELVQQFNDFIKEKTKAK